MTRYAIFVHDPDDDMGHGRIVGPFQTIEAADAKADALRRGNDAAVYGNDIEVIVLPVLSGGTSLVKINNEIAKEGW
jgi:hypothetical protein